MATLQIKPISEKELPFKDRTYRLRRKAAPLSYLLASRDTPRSRLLVFDEDTKMQRPIRYAVNQQSPFIDEQDDHFRLEPVEFLDGFLQVKKEDRVLQWFLHIHPHLNSVFIEVDPENNASQDLDILDFEFEAMEAARKLSLESLEQIGRVILRNDITKLTTKEIKRDVYVFAKRHPKKFLEQIGNPQTQMQAKVSLFLEKRMIAYRNNRQELFFNLPHNKKRILVLPPGENPLEIIANWFDSKEGEETMKMLDKMSEDY